MSEPGCFPKWIYSAYCAVLALHYNIKPTAHFQFLVKQGTCRVHAVLNCA